MKKSILLLVCLLASISSATYIVGSTVHIPQFTGDLYYVDSGQADDTGNGTTPDTAKKTIGAAIALLSAGDGITVKAGTYTEVGLDLDTNQCEMWFEHGTTIAPATGIPLKVSGTHCLIESTNGSLFLTVPAGETGLELNGSNAYVHDLRINCASSADYGIDVNAVGCVITNARCANPLTAAFKISGDKARLVESCTVGSSGDSSIGFWCTDSVAYPTLLDCCSRGHETSGYQVDTGCTGGVIQDCASGGGDGRSSDADHAFVWSGFTYDSEVVNTITLDGSTSYTLFTLTGAVRISNIYGVVETQIANTSSTMYLQLYSTNGTVDITDAVGVNVQADVVGTLYIRNAVSTSILDEAEPDGAPAMAENVNFRDPKTSVDITKDSAAATTIIMILSDAVATGKIHWHAHWEPLSDDGFLE